MSIIDIIGCAWLTLFGITTIVLYVSIVWLVVKDVFDL